MWYFIGVLTRESAGVLTCLFTVVNALFAQPKPDRSGKPARSVAKEYLERITGLARL